MTEQQQVAYIQSQVACAMIEAMGMFSKNMSNKTKGNDIEYMEEDFENLTLKYGIHNNAVIGFFI